MLNVASCVASQKFQPCSDYVIVFGCPIHPTRYICCKVLSWSRGHSHFFNFCLYGFALSAYRGSWRVYVVPVVITWRRTVSRPAQRHGIVLLSTWWIILQRSCLCRSFVATEVLWPPSFCGHRAFVPTELASL